MWSPLAGELVEPWMRAMGRACLYGGLAIAGAWLVCRFLPRMSPGVRSWIWRIVYLKLILLVVWSSPIPMPLLPNPAVRIEQAPAPSRVSPREKQVPATPSDLMLWAAPGPPQELERPTARLPSIALFVTWLAGVLCFAVRTIRNACATHNALRESQSITDPRLRQECEVLSRHLRRKREPPLLRQANVPSPQAVGLIRPVVLFPALFVDQYSAPEVRLVLAHELAHLQRRDLLWGWVRRLVNGLLFFHPLVWVANEQATLAEEIACDETALRGANASISDYAGTLLRVTERSLQMAHGATGLLGAGMSRAYRVMASRFQVLADIPTMDSGFARRRRRRATLLGWVAAAVLLPLGLMTWFHTPGIRQIDPRYPVLSFKVSRGRGHMLSVKREVCHFAGLTLSRAVEDTAPAQSPPLGGGGAQSSATWTNDTIVPGTTMPGRVAGLLRKLGFNPQLDTGAYTSSVYVADESCAFIVRFAHDPRYSGYEDIGASLVDEHGETIPLAPHHGEFPPQSGEFLKFWVLSPAPVTRAKFTLLLRLATEGKDVAVLRLGEL